jgi:hypothetical protein
MAALIAFMSKQVFISHSSHDKNAAQLICGALEEAGVSSWIAPRDIRPGIFYPEAIVDAINRCRLIVLLHSQAANHSLHVLREVELGVRYSKEILPICLEPVEFSKGLTYLVASIQKIDAQPTPFQHQLPILIREIQTLLDTSRTSASARLDLSKATPPEIQFGLIVAWLDALARLEKEGQIRPEQRRRVLRHIAGRDQSEHIDAADFPVRLATSSRWRHLALFDVVSELEVIETILGGIVPADVQQVLFALAFNLPVLCQRFGMRFILVPPGTAPNGLVNRNPFYLGESPVSEAQWSALQGQNVRDPQRSNYAKTGLSFRAVRSFCERAQSAMPPGACLRCPTVEEWRFALGLGSTQQPLAAASAQLNLSGPSTIGLRDLIGVVWQFCQNASGYELRGGSYLRPVFPSNQEPGSIPCQNTGLQGEDVGLRLVINMSTYAI